jgi:DNA helicase-2/ATP-dependent DNA helicase PcrA
MDETDTELETGTGTGTGTSPPKTSSLTDTLNPRQREAVTAPDGPTLVLAGAGTGKTRVIVARIAYLIEERGVSPDAILAVTFTNKAAEEMKQRVRSLLSERAGHSAVAVHTFHAMCLRFLRRYGEDVGLPRGFSVIGEDDRRALLRRLARETGLVERDLPIGRLSAAVSSFKHRGFSSDAGEADSRRGPHSADIIPKLAQRYQEELVRQGAADFDDLLLKGVELLECSERAQEHAAMRCRHVLVDEYQDTNRVQFRLLRLLAPHGNVFVVGDEDQSIYRFRGADLRNILDFERDFPRARVVKLETNYRSTPAILRAAQGVIGRNEERKGKTLVAASASTGASVRDEGLPELLSAEDEHEEARLIADRLSSARSPSASLPRAAVLVRTHAQTRAIEEVLVARRIPHQVVGGLRFYERREIKDALAYLRLAVNPHDDQSFLRVVNSPPRGVGDTTVSRLTRLSRAANASLWDGSERLLGSDDVSGRGRLGLTAFREVVSKLKTLAEADAMKPTSLLKRALAMSGLLDAIQREGPTAARERGDNLDQLTAAAAEYESREDRPSVAGFLDGVSLLSDADQVKGKGGCLLMTLHAAKGLEFDMVFLAGLEDGLFPHVRALGDPSALEEERRLFYVGMTRARKRLVLTYARTRRLSYQAMERTPSRFLAEIPQDGLDYRDTSDDLFSRPPSLSTGVSGLSENRSTPRKQSSPIRPGVVVRHEKFGQGTVVETTGQGADRRITVIFDKAGRKRLLARYAKLSVVSNAGPRLAPASREGARSAAGGRLGSKRPFSSRPRRSP